MAGSRRQDRDGVSGALAGHLCAYCAVGACLAVGLYVLFQPARQPNPGLAAYKALPGTIISYELPARLRSSDPLVSVAVTAPELETTGRSTRAPPITGQPDRQPDLVPASLPAPRQVKRPERAATTEDAPPQRSACIPGYDSSGAQTRPC
jgi:hypothetical protein